MLKWWLHTWGIDADFWKPAAITRVKPKIIYLHVQVSLHLFLDEYVKP
jgi:hypothetical protein